MCLICNLNLNKAHLILEVSKIRDFIIFLFQLKPHHEFLKSAQNNGKHFSPVLSYFKCMIL